MYMQRHAYMYVHVYMVKILNAIMLSYDEAGCGSCASMSSHDEDLDACSDDLDSACSDDLDAGLLAAVGEVVVARADVVVLSAAEAQQRALVRRRRVVQLVVHVVLLLRRVGAAHRRLEAAGTRQGQDCVTIQWPIDTGPGV